MVCYSARMRRRCETLGCIGSRSVSTRSGRDRFQSLTRYDELARVLEGIDVATPIFPGLKIDTVVIRGVNDDELVDLMEFARARGAELRFIEYMDVGGATHWAMSRVVPRAEILERLAEHYGPAAAIGEASSAPADRYRLPDGTVFGIISSTTEPFCSDCDRSRLTADGLWYLCLYAARGTDLRGPAARRRIRRGSGRDHPHRLGGPGGSRGRTPAGVPGSFAADPGRHAPARSASRDAHPRRLTPPLHASRFALLCSRSRSACDRLAELRTER